MIEDDDDSPLHQACFDVIEQHGPYLPPNQFTLPAAIDAKVAELEADLCELSQWLKGIGVLGEDSLYGQQIKKNIAENEAAMKIVARPNSKKARKE